MVSATIVLFALGNAIAKTARGPEATRATAPDPARAKRMARSIATREPGLRAKAVRQFPGDHWSQDDAFHAHEQHLVRNAAAREGVAVARVLDALDAYLRSHPDEAREAGTSPCKPRPFYD